MKDRRWKDKIVSSLEIPGDLAMKEPVVTVTGQHQASICNYRSILRYEKDEIVILTFHGRMTIRGRRLYIPRYSPEEMWVQGLISEIVLER